MKRSKNISSARLSDLAGISVSGLCVIHCILTPVIFSLAPAFSHFLPADELTHRVLALSVTGIGALAFRSGHRKHREKIVLWMMGLGLGTIGFSAFAGDWLPSHGYEIAVTVTGGAFLITAHLLNRTFCQKCARCEPAHQAMRESSQQAISKASEEQQCERSKWGVVVLRAKRYDRFMVRKFMSMVLVLSLVQLSAFAADCDLNCFLTHSHHHHSAELPQSHHDHHSDHMHSAHPTQTADSFGAVPQCHQGAHAACSADCASKTSASPSALSAARHAAVHHAAKTPMPAITSSPLQDVRRLFLPSGHNGRSSILRI